MHSKRIYFVKHIYVTAIEKPPYSQNAVITLMKRNIILYAFYKIQKTLAQRKIIDKSVKDANIEEDYIMKDTALKFYFTP